jgi:hypothetical protein
MQKRHTGSDRVLLELKNVNATANGAIVSLEAFCTPQRTRISVTFTQCPLITALTFGISASLRRASIAWRTMSRK